MYTYSGLKRGWDVYIYLLPVPPPWTAIAFFRRLPQTGEAVILIELKYSSHLHLFCGLSLLYGNDPGVDFTWKVNIDI